MKKLTTITTVSVLALSFLSVSHAASIDACQALPGLSLHAVKITNNPSGSGDQVICNYTPGPQAQKKHQGQVVVTYGAGWLASGNGKHICSASAGNKCEFQVD